MIGRQNEEDLSAVIAHFLFCYATEMYYHNFVSKLIVIFYAFLKPGSELILSSLENPNLSMLLQLMSKYYEENNLPY